MGNCQAAEGATVVIQHPGGRVERLYWPTSAADVMKSNPGFYVALVTLYVSEEKPAGDGGGAVRLTRVRLLKAKDMLLLGQVYRLITSQEVTKALRQRKYEKLKKTQAAEMMKKKQQEDEQEQHKSDKAHHHDQMMVIKPAPPRQERDRQTSSGQMAAARGRHWRPSLQSISENRRLTNIEHGEEEEV